VTDAVYAVDVANVEADGDQVTVPDENWASLPMEVTGVAPETGAVRPEITESVTEAAAVAGNVSVKTPVLALNVTLPPLGAVKFDPAA